MNKAVCILGIVVMVAKGTLTPSVSVRCRNPQPDFKETVSVNGTNYMGGYSKGTENKLKICRLYCLRVRIPFRLPSAPEDKLVASSPFQGEEEGSRPSGCPKGSVAFRLLLTTPQTVKRSGSDD